MRIEESSITKQNGENTITVSIPFALQLKVNSVGYKIKLLTSEENWLVETDPIIVHEGVLTINVEDPTPTVLEELDKYAQDTLANCESLVKQINDTKAKLQGLEFIPHD